MRILYVEDNPANLFLVQRVARMGNHEVIHYEVGQAALDGFKDDKPDLVLMDVQLPGLLTGLDVVKALRAAGHRTPIIAVTAYAMSGDRERCLKGRCDGYLAKPLPVGELVELFKRYEPVVKSEPAEVKPEPAPELSDAPSAVSVPPGTAVKSAAPVSSVAEPKVAKPDSTGDETIPSRPTLEIKAAQAADAPVDAAAPPAPADAKVDSQAPAVDAPAEVQVKVDPPKPAATTSDANIPAQSSADSAPATPAGDAKADDKVTPSVTNGVGERLKAEREK